MKKLIYILFFLMITSLCFAEDIYVDADCGDGITVYDHVGDACT